MLKASTERDTPTEGRPERRRPAIRADKVICCPIGDALLAMIGISRPPAPQLEVELNDESGSVADANVITWQLGKPAGPDTHGFLALVPLAAPQRRLPATMRLRGGTQGRRYVVGPRPANIEEATKIVAELAGSHLSEIASSVADALLDGNPDSARLATVATFLRTGTQSDGCIELLGEARDREIFIQGWWRTPLPGLRRVFVAGETPLAGECAVAAYMRDDLPKGASGFVGLLRAAEAPKPGGIDGFLFEQRGGWRYVPVLDHRTVAGALETPSLIRSVVLNTRGSSDILLRLRAAANQFDGGETISGLPLPVRMGIDTAFEVDGGLLLSGWLLDPDGHVEEARLRGGNTDARLDDLWTRYDRPDVSGAFTDHPPFNNTLVGDRHGHGFVVFAQKIPNAPTVPLHIELRLNDARRAFMPLSPTRIAARTAAMRQIRSIDTADWALPEIIDRQIIPFLAASERTTPEAVSVADFGPFAEAPGPVIVIGLCETEEQDIAPLLALLALDPETRHAPIAVAVPADRRARLSARLARLADFYKLAVRLVAAEHAADVYDLFEAGAKALSCETIILLSPAILPFEEGWYGKLVSAHGQHADSVVSPTLAYEDHSIRWAGSWIAAPGADRPLSSRYAGYPVSAVTGLGITRIAAASFECCIMPREALLAAGGFSQSYLGKQEKGLDLGLELSRSGRQSYWLPSVQMLGADEAATAGDASLAALTARIDRTIFDARWSTLLVDRHTSSKEASA